MLKIACIQRTLSFQRVQNSSSYAKCIRYKKIINETERTLDCLHDRVIIIGECIGGRDNNNKTDDVIICLRQLGRDKLKYQYVFYNIDHVLDNREPFKSTQLNGSPFYHETTVVVANNFNDFKSVWDTGYRPTCNWIK